MWVNKDIFKAIAVIICCFSLTGCFGRKSEKTNTTTTSATIDEDKTIDTFRGEDTKPNINIPGEQITYYFQLNSDKLDTKTKYLLNNTSQYLNEHPEKNIVLEGHADAQGPDAFNEILSYRRANSVKAYLEYQNVHTERMEVYGHSNKKLAVLGESEEAHAKNRRVELKLID